MSGDEFAAFPADDQRSISRALAVARSAVHPLTGLEIVWTEHHDGSSSRLR